MDADDGYGDVKRVVRTIQGYEATGASGVLLKDQSSENKQPGTASAPMAVTDHTADKSHQAWSGFPMPPPAPPRANLAENSSLAASNPSTGAIT